MMMSVLSAGSVREDDFRLPGPKHLEIVDG